MQKTALPQNPSLYLLSLGCPKNRVDSEVMLGSLLDEGYRIVEEPEEAEVILINSCAFIGEAKQESIDAILQHAQLKETGKCKALVVAGCLTQRYADVLQAEMPEVDYFVGTSAYPRIASILRGERDRAVIPDPDYIADAKTPRRNSMPSFTAYVKIAEGCDNKCTFCIIPTLRGLQRSRPIKDIVAEAQRLVAEGAVELNLVAQDLTAYGHDLPGKPTDADRGELHGGHLDHGVSGRCQHRSGHGAVDHGGKPDRVEHRHRQLPSHRELGKMQRGERVLRSEPVARI